MYWPSIFALLGAWALVLVAGLSAYLIFVRRVSPLLVMASGTILAAFLTSVFVSLVGRGTPATFAYEGLAVTLMSGLVLVGAVQLVSRIRKRRCEKRAGAHLPQDAHPTKRQDGY